MDTHYTHAQLIAVLSLHAGILERKVPPQKKDDAYKVLGLHVYTYKMGSNLF